MINHYSLEIWLSFENKSSKCVLEIRTGWWKFYHNGYPNAHFTKGNSLQGDRQRQDLNLTRSKYRRTRFFQHFHEVIICKNNTSDYIWVYRQKNNVTVKLFLSNLEHFLLRQIGLLKTNQSGWRPKRLVWLVTYTSSNRYAHLFWLFIYNKYNNVYKRSLYWKLTYN